MLASGATFIARGYTHGIEALQRLFREAILHKGFSFVDVLQVCVSFFNLYESYNRRVFEVQGNDLSSFEEAQRIIRSWSYDNSEAPVPLGKFYQINAPTFDQVFPGYEIRATDRDKQIDRLLKDLV
jgi:2-oxoglutarate ferredoxin oxidoreductase subunit beta